MKKERITKYLIIILLIVASISTVYFFNFQLTGFNIYWQVGESDFKGGIYNNTEYSESGIVLSEGELSGTYISKVFDVDDSVQWNNISWHEILPTTTILLKGLILSLI